MTMIRTGVNLQVQLLHLQQQGSHPMEHISDRAPIALIFADNDDGVRATNDAVVAAGGRVCASVGIAEASIRLADQAVADTIIIDVTHDHGDTLDQLLKAVDDWAEKGTTRAILSAPLDMIDLVGTRLFDNRLTVLCQPDTVDRLSAITSSWMPQSRSVNDISTEIDSIRVKRIAEEVSRLSRSLSRLVAGSLTPADRDASLTPVQGVEGVRLDFHAEPMAYDTGPMVDAAEVRSLLRLRRMRGSYFSSDLFADPAWDMLLDLMAAQLEGEKVAVSSLCIAAAVPATTALRWIKTMCDHGLFDRHADPLDGRRIFIALSPGAAKAMTGYLSAAKRMGGLTV
jgi:DNA-binding MarR family transcriptional regulator